MAPPPLTAAQSLAIEVATRTTSVLSVLGSSFIISTFVCFPFFRKPINRLVFYATWGNLLANVATLMSSVTIPRANFQMTALCEFQGVLIQWFMMADSLWVLCMATNVFLVFFYGYDSQQIRHLEKWYLVFAYGVPSIPALVYIILDHTGHRVIGPATLWCWVDRSVDWMRISFFYAPVWIVISATITIYVVTGLKIFQKRALLRSFSRPSKQSHISNGPERVATHPHNSLSTGKNIVVTTQIKHDIQQEEIASQSASIGGDEESMSSYSSTRNLANASNVLSPAPLPAAPAIRTHHGHRKSAEMEQGSHYDSGNERSGYRATAFASPNTVESALIQPGSSVPPPLTRVRTAEGNAAAMAYLQVAFLMFIALFVVWVPSSGALKRIWLIIVPLLVNRVYQFIHRDKPSFPLNITSAIVLPLQGAWNATIYIFTTRSECRRAFAIVKSKLTGNSTQYQPRTNVYRHDTMTSTRETRDSDAEVALDELSKQGGRVRQSEMSSPNNLAAAKLYGYEGSR